jgi:hypothetical protein
MQGLQLLLGEVLELVTVGRLTWALLPTQQDLGSARIGNGAFA